MWNTHVLNWDVCGGGEEEKDSWMACDHIPILQSTISASSAITKLPLATDIEGLHQHHHSPSWLKFLYRKSWKSSEDITQKNPSSVLISQVINGTANKSDQSSKDLLYMLCMGMDNSTIVRRESSADCLMFSDGRAKKE